MHLGFLQKPTNIVGFTSVSASVSSGVTTTSFIDKRCAYNHRVYVIYLFFDSATRFLVQKMPSLNYPYVSPTHSKFRESFRPLRNLRQNV